MFLQLLTPEHFLSYSSKTTYSVSITVITRPHEIRHSGDSLSTPWFPISDSVKSTPLTIIPPPFSGRIIILFLFLVALALGLQNVSYWLTSSMVTHAE